MDFSDILKIHGYDPKEVRLARHSGHDGKVYSLWLNDKANYDLYCRLQRPENFGRQKYVAHFIALPDGSTLFTGFYRLNEAGEIKPGTTDPISGIDLYQTEYDRPIIYDVTKIEEFNVYAGKLFIDWGKSARSWSQIASGSKKPVTEIRKTFAEPEFPGFSKFNCASKYVSTLPDTWKAILSANKGVYILVHKETGTQYIGSAAGENGFLGRWIEYEANGHGGNVLLKKLNNREYDIGILEVCSSSYTAADIIRREQDWKHKLGSRAFGLNGN